MALTTPNMSLSVWNSLTDPYDHAQLASNFIALDQHDHSVGKGTQINGATGIKDYSITGSKMSSDFALSFRANSIPGSSVDYSTVSAGSIPGSAVNLISIGYDKIATVPWARMYSPTTQTFTGLTNSPSWVLVNYTTQTSRPLGTSAPSGDISVDLSANTFTVNQAGVYLVQFYTEWQLPGSGDHVKSMQIQFTGSQTEYAENHIPSLAEYTGSAYFARQNLTAFRRLAVSDVIKSNVAISSTTSANWIGNSVLSAVWIGA